MNSSISFRGLIALTAAVSCAALKGQLLRSADVDTKDAKIDESSGSDKSASIIRTAIDQHGNQQVAAELAEESTSDEAAYTKHGNMNCYHGSGAGKWFQQHATGTGVKKCKEYCDALPYGDGDNHCSLIAVRKVAHTTQCYVKSGPVVLGKCQDVRHSSGSQSWDVYVRKPTSKDPEFSINLEKSSELGIKDTTSLLGMRLDVCKRGDGACITGLDNGLVSKWNVKNPYLAVKVKDEIVAVNGVRGSYDELVNQLTTADSLKLVIRKGSDREKPRPGPPTRSNPKGTQCGNFDKRSRKCRLQSHKGASCDYLEKVKSEAAKLAGKKGEARIPNQLVVTGRPESFKSVEKTLRMNLHKILGAEKNLTLRWLGDNACRRYIRKYFHHHNGSLNIQDHYDNEQRGAFRGDICRAAVLFREGGYYIDMDVALRTPLTKMVNSDTGFMTAFSYLNPKARTKLYGGSMLNAIMAAAPLSPVLAATLFEIDAWYKGDPSVPWGHTDGCVHMGPLTLWRGLARTMQCMCPDQKNLDEIWLALNGTSPSPTQWPCGQDNIRLLIEKRLDCQNGGNECEGGRANATFDGIKYGIFNPEVGRNLVAWPRLAGCKHYGCHTGGHVVDAPDS